jgi:hypothetical protein
MMSGTKTNVHAKALVAQRKHAKSLSAACSLLAFLCAFAPLREIMFSLKFPKEILF